jgi:hypothetical protein
MQTFQFINKFLSHFLAQISCYKKLSLAQISCYQILYRTGSGSGYFQKSDPVISRGRIRSKIVQIPNTSTTVFTVQYLNYCISIFSYYFFLTLGLKLIYYNLTSCALAMLKENMLINSILVYAIVATQGKNKIKFPLLFFTICEFSQLYHINNLNCKENNNE